MHRFDLRVYYEDTDAGGIVYYANYLKFAERARTEALRSIGIEQTALMREHNVGFVVRHCAIDFKQPARLDDLLTVETLLCDLKNVSLTMEQHIFCKKTLLAIVHVKLAVINKDMTLTKLPTSITTELASFCNTNL